MNVAKRIQLKRTKGWKIPPNTVKVDRTTKWGNPWPLAYWRDFAGMSEPAARKHCFDLFHSCMHGDEALNPEFEDKMCRIRQSIRELRGKDLACWCKPDEPCHADVLLELANK